MRLICAIVLIVGGGFTVALSEIGLGLASSPGSSGYYVGLMMCLFGTLFAVIEYGRSVRKERAQTRESRCRRCGYILHGLSEPRCPECGEPI